MMHVNYTTCDKDLFTLSREELEDLYETQMDLVYNNVQKDLDTFNKYYNRAKMILYAIDALDGKMTSRSNL